MCLQGAMPVPPSSKTNLWRRLPITERSGGRQDAEWLRETDSSLDPFYNLEFRKLAVYDNRYCPKRRFCLPIIAKRERVSADGVVVWPCLRRSVKPNRPG